MLALAAGWLAAPAALRADPTDPVALVNGEKVTEGQVIAELKARWGYQAREQLIAALVVEQAAKAKGVTVSEAEIDTAFAQAQQAINDQGRNSGQTFTDWLLAQEQTIPTYRRSLRLKLLLEKMVKADPNVQVSNDEVKNYYDMHKADLTREEAVEIAFIAVGTKQEADQLHADLLANKTTWDQAAKDKNLDPWGRDSSPDHPGGYFGFIKNGDQPIQKAAFGLTKDGDLSAPFEEPDKGWLLVKRISYQTAGVPTFEVVQKGIHEQLAAQKLQAAAQKQMQALLVVAQGNIQRLGDIKEPVPAS
jgi:parvulin-like peptidyl-prolyl isomerase